MTKWQQFVDVVKSAFNSGKWLIGIIVINYFLCVFLYMIVEGKDFITSLWWAVVSGFTVGYGDQFPVLTEGRMIGIYLIVSSWFLSLVAGAIITASVIKTKNELTEAEQQKLFHSNLLIGKTLGIYPLDMEELPEDGYVPPALVVRAERADLTGRF